MFRDGQYLELIKASDDCLATAVVTVQERTMRIRKKEVSTNKWLDLEDWAALYRILEKAILRNGRHERCQELEKCEWRKSTRQLEVTYTFEWSEDVKDVTSLPTIRVNVSPAKKRVDSHDQASKREKGESHERKTENVEADRLEATSNSANNIPVKKSENIAVTTKDTLDPSESRKNKSRRYLQSDDSGNNALEEYVPDAPAAKRLCSELRYVPSRKSALERIQTSSNEYTPTIADKKTAAEVVRYVPNSVSKTPHETYEPRATTSSMNLPDEYVPNSKGAKPSVEEYQPDFTSKSMKFDTSYVPSSVQVPRENSQRSTDDGEKSRLQKHASRRKGSSSSSSSSSSAKKKVDLFA